MISLFAKRAKATTAKMSKKKGEEEPPHASQGIKIPLDSTGRPFTAKEFNKPDSGLYFRNDRGQRIHTRRWLPASAAEAKGVIFYFHGYGGHCNNGEKEEMAAAFTSAGFAVFMLDAHGHGYSDGERVFLKDWQHLVDDAMLYANLVLNYGAAEEAAGGRDVNLGIDVNLWGEFLKSAPFAFMGHSLGGAVAILTSSITSSDANEHSARFIGAILLCPAVSVKMPPAPVPFIVQRVLAPLFPMALTPAILDPTQRPENLFTSEEATMKFYLDRWGCEGGLAWGKSLRIGTANQMLRICSHVAEIVPTVTFPFVVMHDPEDPIVLFSGTKLLLEKAASPVSRNTKRARELHKLPRQKHELMANCRDTVCAIACGWLSDRLVAGGHVSIM